MSKKETSKRVCYVVQYYYLTGTLNNEEEAWITHAREHETVDSAIDASRAVEKNLSTYGGRRYLGKVRVVRRTVTTTDEEVPTETAAV